MITDWEGTGKLYHHKLLIKSIQIFNRKTDP